MGCWHSRPQYIVLSSHPQWGFPTSNCLVLSWLYHFSVSSFPPSSAMISIWQPPSLSPSPLPATLLNTVDVAVVEKCCCAWSVAVIVFAANRTEKGLKVVTHGHWQICRQCLYYEDHLITNRYCPTESFSFSTLVVALSATSAKLIVVTVQLLQIYCAIISDYIK